MVRMRASWKEPLEIPLVDYRWDSLVDGVRGGIRSVKREGERGRII